MKIVILGLGSAGFAAALGARKQNREAEIVIIDKKDYDLSHPCGMPYFIEGKISKIESLKHNLGLDKMRIIKYGDSKATKLNTEKKEVSYDGNGGNSHIESYDKLIICTGARPFIPPIKGIEKAYKALEIEDVGKIKDNLHATRKAVIVGAGAIGLEKAYALKENNVKVTVVDILPRVLPNLIDEDISEQLEEYLKTEGIGLSLGKGIISIEDGKVILEGSSVECNMTILAAGVRPNVDIVKGTSIKVDKAILVDGFMQTNIPDVYAAGDCIQAVSAITKNPAFAQLATTAYMQGNVAGTNAAGGNLSYPGAYGTFVSKIGKMEIAATGLNFCSAKKAGYETVFGKATASIKPDWFPGGKKLTIKILADKRTDRIIGAQAIGEEGAAARINIISTAIKAGFNFRDLSSLELAYCPAVSDIKDVLVIAAEIGQRKLSL